MDITLLLQATILGLVEGLTEFLPVSSTAHLLLVGDLLGFNDGPGKVFEVVIQLGAILAVCWVYRVRFYDTAIHLRDSSRSRHFVRNIALAFLPSVVVGFFLHGFIKDHLFNPQVIALALVVGAMVILWVESKSHNIFYHEVEDFPWRLALLIGIFQSFAVIPGVSRSGATIMGALVLGADRKAATEFSFFLAIPTMLAASIYDIYKNWDLLTMENFELIAVGFVAAFCSAIFVVKELIHFVSRHGFVGFAWYRIALGLVVIGMLYWDTLSALWA
jgi:undecaprenyl-diphosphatase